MDQDALKLRRSIAALLLSGALAPAALSAQDLRETAVAAPAEVEVFVQLSTQAVAEFNAAALAATGAMPDGAAQRAHAARVSQEQAGMRARLEAAGATVLSSQRVGANGLRIRVSPERVADLRNMSGVRTVGRVETHELHHTESVPWVGAPDFWTTHGLTGEGVRVGVIDTGIDYTHANFGGPGTVAAYTSNNRNVIEAGTFPTTKVVGGFDFAGPTYNANVAGSTPTPDADPIDVNGHGSHVAGSVAGLGVPGSIGQGVAPGASLYALKVFGDGGGSTNLTSLAIEWAMDPNGDGDMSDHLDVINMSLGSPFGEPNDPSAISSNNAADLGIIVVTSAGNEGDTPYVTGARASRARRSRLRRTRPADDSPRGSR
jgi:subtilisin family serine protease